MIPFARVLKYGNIAPDLDRNVLLDVDFSKQEIGDTRIVDFSSYAHFFTFTSGALSVVEYDSVLGTNVMKFTGATYVTPKPSDSELSLRNMDFEVQMTFKSSSSALGNIWETGNYTASGRTGGITCMVNQYPQTFLQFFFDTGVGSSFTRVQPTGTNQSIWDTYTLRYIRGSGITVRRASDNALFNYPVAAFNAGGTQFSIGGDYVYPTVPNYFIGSIQKLRISKIE